MITKKQDKNRTQITMVYGQLSSLKSFIKKNR